MTLAEQLKQLGKYSKANDYVYELFSPIRRHLGAYYCMDIHAVIYDRLDYYLNNTLKNKCFIIPLMRDRANEVIVSGLFQYEVFKHFIYRRRDGKWLFIRPSEPQKGALGGGD